MWRNYTTRSASEYPVNKEIKILSLTLLLGLVTYFVHGVLNNFLDTDKASVPFWGFIAMIVVLDVYYKNTELKDNIKPQ